MKAIRIEGIGGPEQLKVVEIESAKALSGEVLINVELAGVNFIDVYHRRGQYQLPLPTGLGIEGIGRSTSGEKFFWLSAMGSYAQEITIPRKNLTTIPDTQLSNEELLPLLWLWRTRHGGWLLDGISGPKLCRSDSRIGQNGWHDCAARNA